MAVLEQRPATLDHNIQQIHVHIQGIRNSLILNSSGLVVLKYSNQCLNLALLISNFGLDFILTRPSISYGCVYRYDLLGLIANNLFYDMDLQSPNPSQVRTIPLKVWGNLKISLPRNIYQLILIPPSHTHTTYSILPAVRWCIVLHPLCEVLQFFLYLPQHIFYIFSAPPPP